MEPPLTSIAEGVFEARDWLRIIPGFYFDIRMTILRLPGGALVLHSPLSLNDARRRAIDALGPVAYIIAPNRFHHLFAGDWKEAYPEAVLMGPASLEAKRRDLKLDRHLGEPDPEPWGDAFLSCPLKGAPFIDETAFFHAPSKTLIATDMLFNMAETRGPLTPLVMTLIGCGRAPAQSWDIKLVTRDRAAAAASIRSLLAHDFDRLIVAHGDVIEDGGKAALESAFAWLLAYAPR